MGRFGNEYLAESVGYNNGHANGMADGIAVGREHGYTQGWNEATIHANSVIDERNQEIERLESEIHKGNAYIKELRAALEKSQRIGEQYHVERDELGVETARLKQQAQSLRAEHEVMFKAFLGAVSIARPAMRAVSKLPLQERSQIYYQYAEEAVDLQSLEYVQKNQLPDKQPLLLKYLPIANQVINQTRKQLHQQEDEGIKKEVRVDIEKAVVSYARNNSNYNISNNSYRHEE